MALHSLFLATLASPLNAHTHDFTYSITATVEDLTIAGGTIESIEYDADNDVYYFISRATGRIGTISGSYPGSSDDAGFTLDAYPFSDKTNSTNGMVSYDGTLYIANFATGYVQSFDVSDGGSFTNVAEILVGINGLCQVWL